MKENKSIALKGNGGITLIALVITIIVLIILAGISIAMISGQDGIISKAGKGAAANQIGAAKDKCTLLAAESVNDVYDQVYVKHKLVAAKITDTINATLEAKTFGAKSEIEKILGNTTDGLTVYDATGAAVTSATVPENAPTKTTDTAAAKKADKIVLKYSDGTTVTGEIANGVITWNDGDTTK